MTSLMLAARAAPRSIHTMIQRPIPTTPRLVTTLATLLQTIKRDFRSRIVIFDLPPLLIGDDVISILPQMDAVLLVAGIGTTSVADIKECQKHLRHSNVVRVVVNKVTEDIDTYQAYY